MPMKILVALAFAAILMALASAGVFMLRDRDDATKSHNMMRALAWRVGLSVLLFLCIIISWELGWIQPTGIPVSG